MHISLDEEEINSDNSDDYNFAAPEKNDKPPKQIFYLSALTLLSVRRGFLCE